jgi:hypothetical protein
VLDEELDRERGAGAEMFNSFIPSVAEFPSEESMAMLVRNLVYVGVSKFDGGCEGERETRSRQR